MYKAPERRELTEEERIAVTAGAPDPRDAEEATAAPGIAGTGITVFAQVPFEASECLSKIYASKAEVV